MIFALCHMQMLRFCLLKRRETRWYTPFCPVHFHETKHWVLEIDLFFAYIWVIRSCKHLQNAAFYERKFQRIVKLLSYQNKINLRLKSIKRCRCLYYLISYIFIFVLWITLLAFEYIASICSTSENKLPIKLTVSLCAPGYL